MKIKIAKSSYCFEIKGSFYTKNKENFRRLLEIKNINSIVCKPDLMVVMMNPGSSTPLDDNFSNPVLKEAKADPTQRYIARFMAINNLNYARVINLSDYCHKENTKFGAWLNKQSNDDSHSLFSNINKDTLENLFIKDVPVLVAWGSLNTTSILKKKAFDYFSSKNIPFFGFKKSNNEIDYFHPLARKEDMCDEILVREEFKTKPNIWLQVVCSVYQNSTS